MASAFRGCPVRGNQGKVSPCCWSSKPVSWIQNPNPHFSFFLSVCVLDPMDFSPPGYSIHGISQARILEWVAISFSSESSQPRDQTQVPHIVCGFFTAELPGKPNLVMLVVKNSPINAGDTGLIPGLGRFTGEGNSNPLQYSCQGNPMVRRAWQTIVHGIAKRTWLSDGTGMHTHSKEMKTLIWKSICSSMFIVTSFTTAKTWIQSKWLEVEEWIKKMWYMYLQWNSQFSSVHSRSPVWHFATPWTAAHQASLSITNITNS